MSEEKEVLAVTDKNEIEGNKAEELGEATRSPKKEISLRPYQKECLDAIEEAGPGKWLVAMSMGLGKCLAKGTPVIMADGSVKKVEDIRNGEYVMGPDGQGRLVSCTACGYDTLYKITQEDGMTYTVNSPHILSLKITGKKPVTSSEGKVFMPGEICNIPVISYINSDKEFKKAARGWHVAPEYEEKRLPWPAYLLGRWLGNGAKMPQGNLCLPGEISITEEFPDGADHIPPAYFISSKRIRAELFAGILESSSGSVAFIGCSVTVKNPAFKEDIMRLVRSLGFSAKDKGNGKIAITGVGQCLPFRNRAAGTKPLPEGDGLLTKITVEEAGKGEYYGFQLSGPDRLFLLGDYTVTHNTVVFSQIPRQGRTLILSHRDELVRQPEKYYDCSFGIEKAEEHSHGEEVVSASVQSLSGDTRLASFAPDAFDTIIVDEAHHAAAPTYRKVLNHFSGARRVLGFTATPKRGDGVGLAGIFDKIIFNRDIRWGIENGYLARVKSIEIDTDMDLSRAKYTAGDYNQGDLEAAVEQSNALAAAARTYLDICIPQERHTIIYCITKALCRTLYSVLDDMLPDGEAERTIRVLTGGTPPEERAEMLSGFSEGRIRCLINCMVLTEGTDLPICDTIINIRPTCNPSLYAQISGRSLRLYDGKEYGLLVDIRPSDSGRRTLCSAPTLFGLDPSRLDEKQRKKLTDGETDLLEECLDIEGICRSQAQAVQLRIEEVNRFVTESEDMIEEYAEYGYGDLAGELERQVNDRQRGCPDLFGDLVVDVQAAEDVRYKIVPIWGEEITFSEPDVLGNTRIRFALSEGTFENEMKMEDAVKLAQQYCEICRESTACMWDKDTQKGWSYSRITDSQKWKVKKSYKKYGVSERGLSELGRLDASRLIDLASRITESKKELTELSKEQKQIETGKYQEPEKATPEQEAEKRRKAKEWFTAFAGSMQAREEEKKRQEQLEAEKAKKTAAENAAADSQGAYMQFSRNLTYVGTYSASSRQKDYVRALMKRLQEESRDIFPGVDVDELNCTQASLMIDIAKTIQSRGGKIPGGRNFYDTADLLEELRFHGHGECVFRIHYRKRAG